MEEKEKFIHPIYQQTASNIEVQKANARKHSKILTTELKKQGEAVHRVIDTVIQKIQSEIDGMDFKHLAMIDKQEKAVYNTITEIEQTILDLRKLLATSDFNRYADYKCRSEEFKSLPAQDQVILPTFTPTPPPIPPHKINKEQIHQ